MTPRRLELVRHDVIGPLPCSCRVRRERPDPGGQRRQLRLVPGVTGASRTDTDGRARRRRQGRSRSPRHGGVRGRRRDSGDLIPVIPSPWPRSVLVGRGAGKSRPTPAVHFPGAQLPRVRLVSTRRQAPARSAAGRQRQQRPIRTPRRRPAHRHLPVQPRIPGRRSRRAGTGPRPNPGLDRTGNRVWAVRSRRRGLRTGSGDRSSSPSDTSACWVAPNRVGRRSSPTGSASLDTTRCSACRSSQVELPGVRPARADCIDAGPAGPVAGRRPGCPGEPGGECAGLGDAVRDVEFAQLVAAVPAPTPRAPRF
jgi:hypothetical protein